MQPAADERSKYSTHSPWTPKGLNTGRIRKEPHSMSRLCIACLCTALLPGTWAQTASAEVKHAVSENESAGELPELVSDRPDFTESAEVVGKGIMQTESGFARESIGGDAPERSITGPFPLFRIGVSKRVELRFGSDGYTWQRFRTAEGEQKLWGVSDQSFGAKVKLFDAKGWRPDFAVIAAVSAPIGHRDFTSGGYDPEVKLCWAHDMPAGFALSGNFNFSSATDPLGRLFQRAMSASAGHDLVAGFAGYWEYYNISLDRDAGSASIFNSGVTHMIGKNAQLDFSVGKTVTGNLPSWFVSGGIVVRSPLGLFGRR